jgi:predicted esterase
MGKSEPSGLVILLMLTPAGMLPIFASCAPFYRWVSRRFKMGEGDSESTPRGEIEAVDEILGKVMHENGGVESFVGIIGFSQGARLVPGLLLRQLIEERDLGQSKRKFKFGVIIGGPFPPIAMSESVNVEDYQLLQKVPTVHAWGRDDPVIKGAMRMADIAENENCFQMDFAGGHHLPLKDDEARDLCDQILAAYYASGGTYQVGGAESY